MKTNEKATVGKKGRAPKYRLQKMGAVTRLVDGENKSVTSIEGFKNARKLDGYAEVWRNGVRAANAQTDEAKAFYTNRQTEAQALVDFCNARIAKIKAEEKKAAAKAAKA